MGKPISRFEPGKVYVIEFWATWCGPCRSAMPHLSKLQRRYRESVEIVGIAAYEQDSTTEGKRDTLIYFLRGKNIGYRIAFDPTGRMDRAYMDAYGREAIPTAFVIDKNGRIAFIGSPADLDRVLPEVLRGTFDE